jgi:TonB family protein
MRFIALIFAVSANLLFGTNAAISDPAPTDSGGPPLVSIKSAPPGITPPAPTGPPHDVMTFYPEMARHLHEEGFVVIKFVIVEDGTVIEPIIVRSSGFADLDNAALEAVKTWRYKPAMKDGKPIAVRSEANVRFHLEESPDESAEPQMPHTDFYMSAADYPPAALAAKEEGQVALMVGVAEDGNVISADIAGSSGSSTLDQVSVTLAKTRWHFTPATFNGKPIKSVILLVVNWALPAGH